MDIGQPEKTTRALDFGGALQPPVLEDGTPLTINLSFWVEKCGALAVLGAFIEYFLISSL